MSWKRKDYIYCWNCGAKLIQSDEWIEGYNEQTGSPRYHYQLYCPKYGFFSRTHFNEIFEGEDMVAIRWD